MKRKFLKKKYERKLLRRAFGIKENRDFLLAHLKKEWEAVEEHVARDRKKRALYDMAQKTGMAVGFALLGMAALGGALSIAAVAPNMLAAFSRLGGRRRYFHKKDLAWRVRYFRRRGYVRVAKDAVGNTEIRLTNLGREQVVRQALGDLKIQWQDRWDGIWRIVLFDIPERNKWAREGMRESLKRMGFYPLQKSTFIFPYPCRDEVMFLRSLYGIGNAVRFIETSSLETDHDAKEFFSLA